MNVWDNMWMEVMKKSNLKLEEYVRYMDDGRVLLFAIKCGWRWVRGQLRYRKTWREEDKSLSPAEVTQRAVHGSLQEVLPFLKFTTEKTEDFPSG